ncbi:hypothetical protein CHU95_08085 [Niveispirillum lacus]|uniref:DUF885 domain-containing protein n=1 Tax=Niveispirillum lacus TaxID=1981099 RepID=A0A255Z2P1_9PROT|nr:DUF885 domain-containing protein [Niveispirillum lacus]OYQ35184.1 hypothetical protein CHU95_08085 [Niveispirillum lacus]
MGVSGSNAVMGRRGFLCSCCGLAAWNLVGGLLTGPARATTADPALDAFFAKAFARQAAKSPELRTALGLPGDQGAWDDLSDAAVAADDAALRADLATLRRDFPDAGLSPEGRLNKALWEYQAEAKLSAARWRSHDYPTDHFNGRHSDIIDTLTTYHPVRDQAGAQAWLARVARIDQPVDQLIQALQVRAENGVIAPRFSMEKALATTRAVLTGRPFVANAAAEASLLAGFRAKVSALDLPDAEKTALLAEAETLLSTRFAAAWTRLAAAMEAVLAKADDRDGVWKLPDGEAYYQHCLSRHTTLPLNPTDVHALGLAEVKRIHAEMETIKDQVGFKGDLQAFNHFLRTDRQFYFADDDAGREAYIKGANLILDRVKQVLDGQFNLKPKAPLVVQRFERYREASSTIARYGQPAADGSRPGIYYVNLSNMKEMPIWQMEVLAFHEGIPGHHMQIALAQEATGLPDFRRHDFHTAYVEGWGLYSERLPKELGFYADPYSDFGRLTFALWRALRLVMDTGIHAKRWTRVQAIDYFVANSAFTREVAEREVDRYIVYPGQACAYYIGMQKILVLREEAKQRLGRRFDIKRFHDTILGNGSLPLSVLEQVVDQWVKEV